MQENCLPKLTARNTWWSAQSVTFPLLGTHTHTQCKPSIHTPPGEAISGGINLTQPLGRCFHQRLTDQDSGPLPLQAPYSATRIACKITNRSTKTDMGPTPWQARTQVYLVAFSEEL